MATRYVGAAPRHDQLRRCTISLDAEDHAKITRFASSRGWTLSFYLRSLALRHIARSEKP